METGTKLTGLPVITSITDDDLLYVVNDSTGTATSKGIRSDNLFKYTPHRIIVINPHPGDVVDECVVRGYLDGKVYWSSHRAEGAQTALGYEYSYNTLTEVNAEIQSAAGKAGWNSVYNADDELIYVGGQAYYDSIIYRAAIWAISPSTGTVNTYYLNASGEATGDVNELIAILDDGEQLVCGERGGGGLTGGSDYPNGGGLWTIPKATLDTPSTYTRVYEDTFSPTQEWRNITKISNEYVALMVNYTNGKYIIQHSTNLINWTVDIDGSGLSLNDIRAALLYHPVNEKIYAVTVNSSRQIVLRSYDGIDWTATTFTNLTAPSSGTVNLSLGIYGTDLILIIAGHNSLTHSIYLISNLNDSIIYSVLIQNIVGIVQNGTIIQVGSGFYYGTSRPGGLHHVKLWGSTQSVITNYELIDHIHSGTAGDGGRFNAANLNAGTSGDGQVLTSNGSGGVAWEDIPPGGGIALDDLTDVNAPLPDEGDVLTWNTGTSQWIPSPPPEGGIVDATDVTYTPAVATDWNGDADPGDADDALDQLAERVDDLELDTPIDAKYYVGASNASLSNEINLGLGLALSDRPPTTTGTYNEEFEGIADTLPTNWSWISMPTGTDGWTLNSLWPSWLIVEGTGNTEYGLLRSNFDAAATFGLWCKVIMGPHYSADKAGFRLNISNSDNSEKRTVNIYVDVINHPSVRGLKTVSSSESAGWNVGVGGIIVSPGITKWYFGLTRTSNNWGMWYSSDGMAWAIYAPVESHTFTVSKITISMATAAVRSIIGIDWIRYREDTLFPRID